MRNPTFGQMTAAALTLLGALLWSSRASQAQTLAWIDQFGTSPHDNAMGVSADGLGNVYVAGDTGNQSFTVVAEPLGAEAFGHKDIFLRKYHTDGTVQWTVQIGSPGITHADYAQDVSADSMGNVFVTGTTNGDLGGAGFPGSVHSSSFVMRYSADGVLDWVTPIVGPDSVRAHSTTTDGFGNVYVTGDIQVYPDASGRRDTDVFVHKYDVEGNLLWAEQFGRRGDEQTDRAWEVILDSQRNVYVAGQRDSGSDTTRNAFVAKFTENGAHEWTQEFGTDGDESIQAAAIDPQGNVYVTGSTNFGSEIEDAEAYLWKLDANGSLQWMKDVGVPGQEGNRGWALDTDHEGNVYFGGTYYRGPEIGSNDAFVSMLNTDGQVLWTHEFVTEENEFVWSVDFEAPSTLYVAGSTAGVLSGTNAGARDAFVAKLHIDRLFDPGSADFDGNNIIDADDIDLLTQHMRDGGQDAVFDLNADGFVNQVDRTVWVESLALTYFGDSNLDGEFNSSDLVAVFQAGEYEDNVVGNSGWSDGDWNGDGEFSTSDLVLAFQRGGFEQGPRAGTSAVPEPSSALLLASALALNALPRRRRWIGRN